ncbi:accessory factor UbiK family protein [Pokkaliibacter sp. MBI-7]|uniref:accessory factor UbiK family protein n=1 Tax=Pokkaliibacter sp. MBI-7 TaxID=3040600 RepID=UPI00244C44E2|nr:accessory factor UbiK family protein [Pokkaliibacter sp. MBI-7]MDH2433300.1 accessory factor UbiK family protein [Pokkaliibacter sp. MBI-7]
MINSKLFENLQQQLSQGLSSLPLPHEEIQKMVRQTLQSTFAKLDLVTREEFDVQVEVLQRTRARLEALEVRLAALEQGNSGSTEEDNEGEGFVKVNPQADE